MENYIVYILAFGAVYFSVITISQLICISLKKCSSNGFITKVVLMSVFLSIILVRLGVVR